MNKPASELIALADALDAWGSLVSSGYEVPGAGQVMTESAHALRTVATMREALEKIVEGAPKVEPESYCDDFGYFSDDYSDLYFRGVETQHWRLAQIAQDALATPPAQPAPAGGLHPSHVTRSSDASTYDEVCVNCGATDITGGGWGKLAEPCPSEAPHGKPDGAVRDRIARIIDPHSFMDIPFTDDPALLDMVEQSKGDALRKADRILTALHSPKIAAAETSPGDVEARDSDIGILLSALRMHEEATGETFDDYGGMIAQIEADHKARQPALIAAAIDRLDVKAEAKSQEPDAVAAWRVRTPEGYCTRWFDGPPPECYGPYELAYTHPTTKPEAPAVGVDAIKAALCCPDGCCEPKACGAGKHPDEIAQATAIAALIAGGR